MIFGHVITKFSGMDRFIYPWCSAGALRAELRYEPAFPGRVACNKIFSALDFDSFITGWELETIGARIQWTWKVIQAIYWKESRWLRSAFYKRIESINHLINSSLDFWIQVGNLNFEDIFTGARFPYCSNNTVSVAISYFTKLLYEESKHHETCMHSHK